MSELGSYLKQVREEKMITLDDLQRTTKIQKRYLVAIEEGNFDTLPGIFYARAFVKTYAEAIGLNADEVIATYKNELPNPQNEAVDLPSRTERSKSVQAKQRPTSSGGNKRRSISSILIPVLIIGVIVLAVVLAWNYFGNTDDDNNQNTGNTGETEQSNTHDSATGNDEEDESAEPDETEDPAGTDEEEEEPAGDEEEPSAEAELVLDEATNEVQTFTLTNAEAIESIVITMSDGSFVGVRDVDNTSTILEDNAPNYDQDFEPDVAGSEAVNIRIGNGFGVESFVVNGVELELLDRDTQTVIISVEQDEE
ncbi:cytoskeletal protein RodZ [Alkalihalobacillus xiaoxiensis]|uniref:Cytoskeletal protein RodZ n=1 Tax=Shouchella xiaoxiensis TaxID=766895 RepID=A0ABS2SQA3_9BACI|nr:helix-turn-helix domain-containing protein [Shouchella xiaoxiensis]MBM7837712.1 cytoskeletal protein RodZ [Shouchella xiaoxiensis]